MEGDALSMGMGAGVDVGPGPSSSGDRGPWVSRRRDSVAGRPSSVSGAPDSSALWRSHLPSRDTERLLIPVTHSAPRITLSRSDPRGEPADLPAAPSLVPLLRSCQPSPPASLGQRPRGWPANPDSCSPQLCSKRRPPWGNGHWAESGPVPGLAGTSQPPAVFPADAHRAPAPPMAPRAGASDQKRPWTCRH